MGLFNKRKIENRIYTLSEAMKILQTKKYENYTTIPVENGYKLVQMEQPILISESKKISYTQIKRQNFLNNIDARREYSQQNKELGVQNFNNYQSAKKYKSNVNYASYR